ncbi:SPFH domain / Band 7 family protein [Dyella sp. OK004]|uniref:SPFH domain-containing protein n=1 Tax=Dyella sp. OK004 TaxID=1855292 RepID=UPI0008EEBF16|nr:SPFH domain-containing protein [Dyella sp. OK004]SFR95521.1 SPFH domain / Band 7 family protein [Dyella sp. OK004]
MTALILIIALFLLALFASAIKRVPVNQVFSVYRHGKPRRLLQPGTHLVWPGLDRVGHRIDLGGQVLRFQEPLADAHDVRGTVYWQVLEPERADAVIEQADQLIRGGAIDALREEPEALNVDRRDLGTRLKQAMNKALRERGMMVTRVELDFA